MNEKQNCVVCWCLLDVSRCFQIFLDVSRNAIMCFQKTNNKMCNRRFSTHATNLDTQYDYGIGILIRFLFFWLTRVLTRNDGK